MRVITTSTLPSQFSIARCLLRAIAIVLLMNISCVLGASNSSVEKRPQKTPLTSTTLVTNLGLPPDPDNPGAGGGFDSETYFSELLVRDLGECTDQVETEISDWARTFGLISVKKERRPGALLVHTQKPGMNGFFELTYRVDSKRERARVTLFYYSNDGAQHEPSAIKEILSAYRIAPLQDKLETALQCKRKTP